VDGVGLCRTPAMREESHALGAEGPGSQSENLLRRLAVLAVRLRNSAGLLSLLLFEPDVDAATRPDELL